MADRLARNGPDDQLPMRVDLPSGQSLLIRDIEPSDVQRLHDLYGGLDADARYRRFFTSVLPGPEFFERLAHIDDRAGRSLVVIDLDADSGDDGIIVAEADYEVLDNGNGEMAMTIDRAWRGWLGPYLLGLLCAAAERRGVPNLEATILTSNRPMRALTRNRGEGILPTSDWQTVRVVFSSAGAAPTFAPTDRPRVLVEMRSTAFDALDALEDGGYEVIGCSGREHSPTPCPLDCDQACPLAAGADLIVVATPERRDHLLRGHADHHGGVPVIVLPRRAGVPIDPRELRRLVDGAVD